jgi:predicted RNase H-like HicB family nuclease
LYDEKVQKVNQGRRGKIMARRIRLDVKLPIKIIRRKKWVVASCPILDVHSQGETEEKAKKNLVEALSLFFLSCFERGTLDQVLKDCGFRALPPAARQKDFLPSEGQEFINVRIPFIVEQGSPSRCHA